MGNCGQENLEIGGGKAEIDPAILQELPKGSDVVSIGRHGESFWAQTGRIDILLQDGTPRSFFIKIHPNEQGKNMTRSEFQSMSAICQLSPEFVPTPIACGTLTAVPDTHFFLCDFRDMKTEMPDPHQFGALLSAMHERSISPNGKFGFHTTTYAGNLPQYVEWEDSWETFFAKSMRHALDLEIERKGQSQELEDLCHFLFEKVIPRLLRPLESDGRKVKPSLVHGDLWHANSGVDSKSNQPLVFDACCFYAHNEYEFGQWRPACNKFGNEYVTAYNKLSPISPPQEDFEGRLDLYRLKFDTQVSALFIESEPLRRQVIEVMRDLVHRYG